MIFVLFLPFFKIFLPFFSIISTHFLVLFLPLRFRDLLEFFFPEANNIIVRFDSILRCCDGDIRPFGDVFCDDRRGIEVAIQGSISCWKELYDGVSDILRLMIIVVNQIHLVVRKVMIDIEKMKDFLSESLEIIAEIPRVNQDGIVD